MLNFGSVSIIDKSSEVDRFEYNKSFNIDEYPNLKLSLYWHHQNKKFLSEKIPDLKEHLKEEGSFIFITNFPETKVFLYNISVQKGKVIIKENYINKDYYWSHPYFGIQEPAFRM